MIPLLLNCLESQEVVVYTYAAVALDRILSMRVGGSPTLMYALSLCLPPPPDDLIVKFCRFSSADVQPFASQLLNVLLAKIGIQPSPERTAENDFLMRCACAAFFLLLSPSLCLREVFPRCCESHYHGEASTRRRIRQGFGEARQHPPQRRTKPEQPEL